MDNIEWNIFNEGQLLDAMVGHKPVGINKHFQMALICEQLGNNINKDVNPEGIWEHLRTMYNLEALDKHESIPFPNSIREFALPEDDFGELMTTKEDRGMPKLYSQVTTPNFKNTPNRDTNRSTKELKKDTDRTKSSTRNRNSSGARSRIEETPKLPKRPLRGSLKLEDNSLNGKLSPTPPSKRRRII